MSHYEFRRRELLGNRKRKVYRDSREAAARYMERVVNLDRAKSVATAFRRLERVFG